MHTAGEGKHAVWCTVTRTGADIVVVVGGGQRSHVGGLAWCEPDKPAKAIRLPHHFDDLVLLPMAEALCRKFGVTVVAVGGVHIDDATADDIKLLVDNCAALTAQLTDAPL